MCLLLGTAYVLPSGNAVEMSCHYLPKVISYDFQATDNSFFDCDVKDILQCINLAHLSAVCLHAEPINLHCSVCSLELHISVSSALCVCCKRAQ